jgi:hypothetical protein
VKYKCKYTLIKGSARPGYFKSHKIRSNQVKPRLKCREDEVHTPSSNVKVDCDCKVCSSILDKDRRREKLVSNKQEDCLSPGFDNVFVGWCSVDMKYMGEVQLAYSWL